jgi:WD40 repeat protein
MKRPRVYLSSTFEDLKEYRAAVFTALERAGLDVARMEGYTAADERPVDLCLRDVAASDICVGIYAWRYGYVPPEHHDNPDGKSISELEYRLAEAHGLRKLVFFAHPDTKAQWPAKFKDEETGEGDRGAKLTTFRAEIGTEKTASMFRTPDELATLVLAALMRTGLSGRPYNIPPQRPGVVPRLELIDAVRDAIVGRTGGSGANTLVFGGGGFGKTTLALDACHTPEIVKSFPDGMIWVTLGERPDLGKTLSDLYLAIAGEPPTATGVAAIAEAVAKRLEKHRCLVVVDDLWRSDDLVPFLALNGPRLLVTSRIRNLLDQFAPSDWAEIPVDEMDAGEATMLLGRGLALDIASRDLIARLGENLGYWPLLLQLANARLLEEHKRGRSVAESIERVSAVYGRKGVFGFDRRDSTARNTAVARSVEVGLTFADELAPGLAARAAELAIFPDDVTVPVRVLADLWAVDEFDAEEDSIRPLENLSLAVWDRERREVALHDMIRAALAAKLVDAPAVHRLVAKAWGDPRRLSYDFAWRWLAYHLVRGEQTAELRLLLGDMAWLRAKLQATDIAAVIADYDFLPADDPLRLVQGALFLAASYLWTDKAQLASQLAGRLRPGEHAEIDALLDQVRAWRGEPWLRPLRPTLHAAGGPLVRVFRGYAGGHRGTVRSIAIDAAGRMAVSAGNSTNDRCLIVWNLATGTHYKLEKQAEEGKRTPLAMSGKGNRFVSAYGGELRAWQTGEQAPFAAWTPANGHVGPVDVSDDGTRALVGTADGELFLWNPDAAAATLLGRHEPEVENLAITSDGRWAVSINRVDARLWDLAAGCEAKRWPSVEFSRTSWAGAVGISDDGRRVAWTASGQGGAESGLWGWDAATGATVLIAGPPAAGGMFCFRFERGRAIVQQPRSDQRIEGGYALLVFGGAPRIVDLTDIGRGISCAAMSREGRWAITADYEHDLMVWDLDRAVAAPPAVFPAATPPWRTRHFHSFAKGGSFALFGVDDPAPLVWDIEADSAVADLSLAEALLTASREASAEAEALSADSLVRWWAAPEGGKKDGHDRGHTARVWGGAISPHGRWDATVSEDGTVRVGDVAAKQLLAVFSDETMFRSCVWADDGVTLAVTDYRDKTHLLRLEGVD